MKKRYFGDLTGPEVLRIFRHIADTSNRKVLDIVKDFLDRTDYKFQPRTWYEHEDPPMKEDWGPFVHEMVLEAEAKKTVLTFCLEVMNLQIPNIEVSLKEWIKPSEATCPPFILNRTMSGETLRYLVFRSHGGGDTKEQNACVVSEMNIAFDPSKDVLPTFSTEREEKSVTRKLSGQVFQNGSYTYTIGQVVAQTGGIRFSKLSLYNRQFTRDGRTSTEGRQDLYGIRLGHLSGLPFAHFVYAYEIKTMKNEDVEALLKIRRLDDEKLSKLLGEKNANIIIEAICPDGFANGGLQMEPLV